MQFAYLVCFVALLQVCKCHTTVDAIPSTTDASTEQSVPFDLESTTNDTNSTEILATDSTNGTESTETTTEATGEEVETIAYTPVTDSQTTVEDEKSTTSKPAAGGHASLVHPTVFAIIVPVCIRLFSTKLVGVV